MEHRKQKIAEKTKISENLKINNPKKIAVNAYEIICPDCDKKITFFDSASSLAYIKSAFKSHTSKCKGKQRHSFKQRWEEVTSKNKISVKTENCVEYSVNCGLCTERFSSRKSEESAVKKCNKHSCLYGKILDSHTNKLPIPRTVKTSKIDNRYVTTANTSYENLPISPITKNIDANLDIIEPINSSDFYSLLDTTDHETREGSQNSFTDFEEFNTSNSIEKLDISGILNISTISLELDDIDET